MLITLEMFPEELVLPAPTSRTPSLSFLSTIPSTTPRQSRWALTPVPSSRCAPSSQDSSWPLVVVGTKTSPAVLELPVLILARIMTPTIALTDKISNALLAQKEKDLKRVSVLIIAIPVLQALNVVLELP
jgi:hypothetical protein